MINVAVNKFGYVVWKVQKVTVSEVHYFGIFVCDVK